MAIEPRPYGAAFRLRFNKTTRDALKTAVSDEEPFLAFAKYMAPLLSRMPRAAAATELSSDLQRPGKIVEIGESSRFKRLVTERDKVHHGLNNSQNQCRSAAAPAYSPINSGSPVRICAHVHSQTTARAKGRVLATGMHLRHNAFAMK